MSADDLGAGRRQRVNALLELHRDAEAAKLAGEGVVADPSDWRVRTQLALATRRTDVAMARRAVAEAIVLAPEEEWPQRVAARVELDAGKPRSALPFAERAVALAPAAAELHRLLATILERSGELHRARLVLQRALDLKPDDAATCAERARFELVAKEWRAAESWARRALSLDPNNYEALNNLGVARQRQGHRAEALELYASAAALRPQDGVAGRNARSAAQHFGNRTALLLLFIGSVVVIALEPNVLGLAIGVPLFVLAAGLERIIYRRDVRHLPAHLLDFTRRVRREPASGAFGSRRPDAKEMRRVAIVVLAYLALLAVLRLVSRA